MAREAEAEREKRGIIIKSEGEVTASQNLAIWITQNGQIFAQMVECIRFIKPWERLVPRLPRTLV
jgi:hypothetical protein